MLTPEEETQFALAQAKSDRRLARLHERFADVSHVDLLLVAKQFKADPAACLAAHPAFVQAAVRFTIESLLTRRIDELREAEGG